MSDIISLDAIVPSRPGLTPGQDGWTYHHYLPWRYYWLAAYLILCVIKAKEISGKGIKLNEFNVGRDFLSRLDYKRIHLTSIIDGMWHGTPDKKRWDPCNIDIKRYSIYCTCPKFGGFLGMNPAQRIDDPGSSKEKRWPKSSGIDGQRKYLDAIAAILERSCRKIGAIEHDNKINVSMNSDDMNDLISKLFILIDHRFNFIKEFNPTDWGVEIAGRKIKWALVNERKFHSSIVGNGSREAKVFFLALPDELITGVENDVYYEKKDKMIFTEIFMTYKKIGDHLIFTGQGHFMARDAHNFLENHTDIKMFVLG